MMFDVQRFIAFSDFEKFLISCANEWELKPKEVEAKFLELSKMSDNHADVAGEPKRKKRKKKSSVHHEDPFAHYAAELQVIFFKRVH